MSLTTAANAFSASSRRLAEQLVGAGLSMRRAAAALNGPAFAIDPRIGAFTAQRAELGVGTTTELDPRVRAIEVALAGSDPRGRMNRAAPAQRVFVGLNDPRLLPVLQIGRITWVQLLSVASPASSGSVSSLASARPLQSVSSLSRGSV